MAIYTKSTQPTLNDQYETPIQTLDMVLDYLHPEKHFIWEPFPGTGHSTRYMKSKGFTVTNGNHPDFFQQNVPHAENDKELVLVTNPPFSIKRQILERLAELGVRKVALLLPAPVLFTQYFQRYCLDHKVQTIIHSKRCKFIDPRTGKPSKKSASFDIVWICLNIELESDMIFK